MQLDEVSIADKCKDCLEQNNRPHCLQCMASEEDVQAIMQKYEKKELITVCCGPLWKQYVALGERGPLRHQINGHWADITPPKNDLRYSHGVCPECMDRYYPGMRERIEKLRAATQTEEGMPFGDTAYKA